MEDKHISLAHGNGGRLTRELVEEIFARHLNNGALDISVDAATIDLPEGEDVMITTDGFIVQPIEFPGGNIGSLAVNGTVNDLAVSGARPRFLTLNAFIEEGLSVERLDRIVASLAEAAKLAGVQVVAGDTKVAPKNECGELFFATTGVGSKPASRTLATKHIQPGDAIIVSGPVGDHGVCVMLAREDFQLKGTVYSDCAPVNELCEAVADLDGLRFMRDPTRGGLATLAHEVAVEANLQVRLFEADIPVRAEVSAVCEILGYDPYYLACEGRVVSFVARGDASEVLSKWRAVPGGEMAAVIGTVEAGNPRVVLETSIGGERILEELEDDPLPRIC